MMAWQSPVEQECYTQLGGAHQGLEYKPLSHVCMSLMSTTKLVGAPLLNRI